MAQIKVQEIDGCIYYTSDMQYKGPYKYINAVYTTF